MTLDSPARQGTRARFAIDDDTITRIAGTRSRQCNSIAAELGQHERLKASELIDLYFQSGGICAQCEATLDEKNIELDHIAECNYRAARKARMVGNVFCGGKAACIHNVQWLCRFCNRFKENCRAHGIDMLRYVQSVYAQGQSGFPIRAACQHLGTIGARKKRDDIIRQELDRNPQVSAREMTDMLAGTVGEASYPCVLQHMKECGWTSEYHKAAGTQRKLAAVQSVFAQSSNWESRAALVKALNMFIGEELSLQSWARYISKSGLRFSFASCRGFAAAWRTEASVGDKQTVLDILRNAGDCGQDKAIIVSSCETRGMSAFLTNQAIEMLLAECAIYSRDGGVSFVAALTRKEAAKKIGVSWLRLKKWASEAFSHMNAGPAYMKASPKALTYYRHEDVEEFIRSRARTRYDAVGAGGTHEGGKLGGRPRSVCI